MAPRNIYIHTPTIRELYSDENNLMFFNMLTRNDEEHLKWLKTIFPLYPFDNVWELIVQLFTRYSTIREYSFIFEPLKSFCKLIFSRGDLVLQTDTNNVVYQLDDTHFVSITSEIWDYLSFILRLCCGEKVQRPITFSNEMERQFYLAQQKTEQKINKLRAKQSQNTEADKNLLMKVFLAIMYAFPSFTFDYLLDQTMAQIQWLQKYAAQSMSYEVNAQAFAAGNVKKGTKLKSFLDN